MTELIDLYNEDFDSDGQMRLCGREKIEALAEKIEQLNQHKPEQYINEEYDLTDIEKILQGHDIKLETLEHSKVLVRNILISDYLDKYFSEFKESDRYKSMIST